MVRDHVTFQTLRPKLNMNRILLTEDDPNLGLLLQEFLTSRGFVVELATDGNKGLQLFLNAKEPYNLCIFDVMMPKKDGFSLAKEIRQNDKLIPIIFLTAKAMKEDTIRGFRIGADDYITKPFDRDELLLRINAILRRYHHTAADVVEEAVFEIGQFEFDANLQILRHQNTQQKLTSKEAALLRLLCQNKKQSVTRSFALKLIWGDDSYFNARSMDVYVTKLRKHLQADSNVQIMNVHGEGFKLMD